MKILCISNGDSGGNAYFTAEAINRYTEHEARHIRLMQVYLAFPYDLLSPPDSEIARLIEWADVVHGRDYIPKQWLPPTKPTVATFSGMSFRRRPGTFLSDCKRFGWLFTVSTVDLTTAVEPAPLWIPNPREEIIVPEETKRTEFTVCHAPTFRDRKGTDTIERTLAHYGIPLVIIERQPNFACLRMKAACHALADQFNYLYGNNAIECWSMGMPVMSNGSDPRWLAALKKEAGFYPFAQVEEMEASIARAAVRLRDDAKYRQEIIDRGRDYFFKFHHAPKVAERVVGLYKQAMELKT